MTDTAKLAATLEAETMERAGQITYTQARARIRDGQASPVAHLALQQTEAANRLAAALRELHSVCVLMDHPDQMRRRSGRASRSCLHEIQRLR